MREHKQYSQDIRIVTGNRMHKASLEVSESRQTTQCDTSVKLPLHSRLAGSSSRRLLSSGWLLLCLLLLSTALNLPVLAQSQDSSSSETSGATTGAANSPDSKKGAPINYAQVEQLFEASAAEEEVVTRWKRMDSKINGGIKSVLKSIFPQIAAMSTDAKVSGNCTGAFLKWVLNLQNMRTWAFKMLDATGKPSAGLLEGSLTMFGNYRQCLDVRAPDEDEIEFLEKFTEYFRGMYCVLKLKPYLPPREPFYSLNSTIPALQRQNYRYYEKTVYDDLAELASAFNFVSIRADLCMPSLCSRDDIQRVADFLATKMEMRAFVERCEVDPSPINDEPQVLAQQNQGAQYLSAWAFGLFIILGLVVASTGVKMGLSMSNRSQKSRAHSLLTSMSIHKSLSQMRSVNLDRINDQKPAFLYTLRLIFLFWFAACELTRQMNFQFLRQLLQLRSMIMLLPMQILVNGTLQFDALIFITAFTYAYQNINSNIKDLIKYNIAKYSRLMPSILTLVALSVLAPILLRNMSPIWVDFMSEQSEVCRTTGFVNIFFLQNLLDYRKICLPNTWIFCVELQLCIVAIPIVHWMNRNFDSKQGRFALCSWPTFSLFIAIIVGSIMNFQNIFSKRLPAAWFETFPDERDRSVYLTEHLYKTWTHMPVFAMGLLTGHFCRCQSICCFTGQPYGKRSCDNLMWLTALLLMGLSIFSTHGLSMSGTSHLDWPLISATYAALAPLAFALAMALILFYLTVPDSQAQRPRLSALLTADPNLIRLGRLSFLIYLLIPFVHRLVYGLQEQAVFSSIIMLSHTLIGNLVLTIVIAIVMSVLVELPCRRLIKKLALGSKRHCSNLGVLARQLNLRQLAEGPLHDSFSARHPAPQLSGPQTTQQPQAQLKQQQQLPFQPQEKQQLPLQHLHPAINHTISGTPKQQ